MEILTCWTCGEAAGNPGAATVRMAIVDEAGQTLYTREQAIGNSTSDFASYQAVLVGMQSLCEMLDADTQVTTIELWVENEAVASQLNHEAPVTDPGLVPLFIAIHNLRVLHFPSLTYRLGSQPKSQDAS